MAVSLTQLEERLEATDVSGCSDEELAELVRLAHAGRRKVGGYVTRLAAEARRREAAGSAGPADETMGGDNGDVSAEEAKRLAARGGVSDKLPESGAAAESGDTSEENLDHLAKVLDGLTPAQARALRPFDREIASRAQTSRPEVFCRWLNKLIARIKAADRAGNGAEEPGLSEAERQKAESAFGMRRRPDGTWEIYGSIDGERGTEIWAAIRAMARLLAGPDDTITANHRAAALHHLITRTGGSDGDGGSRLSMGIGYIIDAATLGHGPHANTVSETWSGEPHDPAAIARLACDTDWYAVLIDRYGRPTRVGRNRRSATREQRIALRALYRCCPLDGTPFDRCEIHHVNRPHANGGETELGNLVPISADWHHRIHDRGWQLTMAPDRSLTLRKPDGTVHREIRPPVPITQRE